MSSLCQVCNEKQWIRTTPILGVKVCSANCYKILKGAQGENPLITSSLRENTPLSTEQVKGLLSGDRSLVAKFPSEKQEKVEDEFDSDLVPVGAQPVAALQDGTDAENSRARPNSTQKPSSSTPPYFKVYFSNDLEPPRATIYRDGYVVIEQRSKSPVPVSQQVVRLHEIPKRLLDKFLQTSIAARDILSVEQRRPLSSFSADTLKGIHDLDMTVEFEQKTGRAATRFYSGELLNMRDGFYDIFLMQKDGDYVYIPDRPDAVRFNRVVNDFYSDHPELRILSSDRGALPSDRLSFTYVDQGFSARNVYKDRGDGELLGEIAISRLSPDTQWNGASVTISDSTLSDSRQDMLAVVDSARSMTLSKSTRASPTAFATSSAPAPSPFAGDFDDDASSSSSASSTKDLVLDTPIFLSLGSTQTVVSEPNLVPLGIEVTRRNVYDAFSFPDHIPGATVTYPTTAQTEIFNNGEEVLRSGTLVQVGKGAGGNGFLKKTLPTERARVDINRQSDITVRRSQLPRQTEQKTQNERKLVDKVTLVVQNSRDEPVVVRIREQGPGQNWFVEESNSDFEATGHKWEIEPPLSIKDIEAQTPTQQQAFLDADLGTSGANGSQKIYYRIVRVEKLNQ